MNDKKAIRPRWGKLAMNVLICDDEPKVVEKATTILKQYCSDTDISATFHGFTDPSKVNPLSKFDIILLDIDMSKLNGIELARKLRANNSEAIIIFVTNFVQYAPEGYEVQAFRYLLKEDIPQKLIPYFSEAVQQILSHRQIVTISISGEKIDIPIKNILYFESNRRIIIMHLINDSRTQYSFYGNMTLLSYEMQNSGFLRIQKSYLVNMEYIKSFQYDKVYLENDIWLPSSEKNHKELKQQYLKWEGKNRWVLF